MVAETVRKEVVAKQIQVGESWMVLLVEIKPVVRVKDGCVPFAAVATQVKESKIRSSVVVRPQAGVGDNFLGSRLQATHLGEVVEGQETLEDFDYVPRHLQTRIARTSRLQGRMIPCGYRPVYAEVSIL